MVKKIYLKLEAEQVIQEIPYAIRSTTLTGEQIQPRLGFRVMLRDRKLSGCQLEKDGGVCIGTRGQRTGVPDLEEEAMIQTGVREAHYFCSRREKAERCFMKCNVFLIYLDLKPGNCLCNITSFHVMDPNFNHVLHI